MLQRERSLNQPGSMAGPAPDDNECLHALDLRHDFDPKHTRSNRGVVVEHYLRRVAEPDNYAPFLWLHYGDGEAMIMNEYGGTPEGVHARKCLTEELIDAYLGRGSNPLIRSLFDQEFWQRVASRTNLKSTSITDGSVRLDVNGTAASGKIQWHGSTNVVNDMPAGVNYEEFREALNVYRMEPIVAENMGAFFLCGRNAQLRKEMETLLQRTHAAGGQHRFVLQDHFYLDWGTPDMGPTESFWAAMQQGNRKVVLVGPVHLSKLRCMLKYVEYINIPLPVNSCDEVPKIVQQMADVSRKHSGEKLLFVLAGGPYGKIIGYQAFQRLYTKDTIVEVGASLDGFAGRRSRDYNSNLKKFCEESKSWMDYETCTSACAGTGKGKCLDPDQGCS